MVPLTHFALFIACFSFCILSALGCQPAYVDKPVTAISGGNDPDQQIDFWHRLAESPITSYDDAFHAILMFTDGDDPATDYPGRVQAMKNKGLLAAGFNRPWNESVDRGTVSVALAKALKIRGGLVMSIFGASGRYATKELEFLEVYPISTPNQTFSGSEFIAVMSRAEEYQKATQSGTQTGGAGYNPPEMEMKKEKPAAPTTRPATEPAVGAADREYEITIRTPPRTLSGYGMKFVHKDGTIVAVCTRQEAR
jgi:hypothetical protein